MRNIEISEDVWQAIAKHGKFGETEEDVLRRVFNLPSQDGGPPDSETAPRAGCRARRTSGKPRRTRATQRMSSYVGNGQLHVSFAGGASRSWSLPARSDKTAIRSVRDKAVSFARENGATIGQQNAVKKALTEDGYHLTK